MVVLGNFLFHFRNYLFPVIFISLIIFARPEYPFDNARWDVYLDILGFLVALAGQSLRFLTIGYDYIKRGGLDRNIYADRLVTGGVFGHSRNPLYVGNFLIFIGLCLIANAKIMYFVGIPLCVVTYAAIISAEEDYLRKKFGQDYQDYCRRVNRLWPNFAGFATSIEGMEYSWKRVVAKEYNTTFAWLMFTVILIMWDDFSVEGASAKLQAQNLAFLFIPLILFYITVRVMKKAGRLRE